MNTSVKYGAYLIGVTLITVELILWIVAPLPYKFERSGEYHMRQDHPALKKNIILKKDVFGIRSASMQGLNKKEGVIRILFLGASSVEQAPQSIEDTIYGILETKLNSSLASMGVKTEIGGWGEGGDTVWKGYAVSKAEMIKLKPDIVVLLWGVNDMVWKGGAGYNYPGKEVQRNKINQMVRSNDRMSILRAPALVSQIYRRLLKIRHDYRILSAIEKGEIVEWHSQKLPGLRSRYRQLPYIEALTRHPDPIIEFKERLEALVEFLQGQKYRILILGQPVLWKSTMTSDELNVLWFMVQTPDGPRRLAPAWLYEEMKRYNQVQRATADRFGIPFVDLDDLIPKTLDYYFDDCHYTDKGSQAIADAIFPYLEPLVREKIREMKAGRATNII